jgi:hypothetical protein
MFTVMKKKPSLIVPILLILSSAAYAAGYLDRLRGIDQGVLCLVVWFAPAIVVILFSLGGFLYSTGDQANRTLGKSYMLNSLAGLFLSVALIGMAFALVPTLKIDKCLGEAEKTCVSMGGKCGCGDGQVCKTGARVSDVSDCPDTCCKLCEAKPVEVTCESKGYTCGECPTGKSCVESSTPGCEEGKRCCECVDETCQDKNYVCGCPDGQECEQEKPELGGCDSGKTCCAKCKPKCCLAPVAQSKCADCENPSNALCFASNCNTWPLPCKNCHDIAGCHYTGSWRGGSSWWWRCMSCCSGDYKADSCEKYVTKPACEENPCQVSKGGCVQTSCKWTCDAGDEKSGCCSAA